MFPPLSLSHLKKVFRLGAAGPKAHGFHPLCAPHVKKKVKLVCFDKLYITFPASKPGLVACLVYFQQLIRSFRDIIPFAVPFLKRVVTLEVMSCCQGLWAAG